MNGTKNKKYTEIQQEIKKKEKLKEIFYDHDDDTVYVDSYRNISVALGEVTDLSKELKDKGFENKEVVGGPSLKMFHTEAKFQLRHHKFEVALLSISLAEEYSKELPIWLLATKASVLVCLCQFEKSLLIAESILRVEPHNSLALNVSADCLFNLCMFEQALVMYHRAGNQKGVDNCEETISRLLQERSLSGVAAVIAGQQLGSLGTDKRLVKRAARRFRSHREDKLEREDTTADHDRLRKDKEFLFSLTKLETRVQLIKRRHQYSHFIYFLQRYFLRRNGRSISVHAKEILDYLKKREHFWYQLNK